MIDALRQLLKGEMPQEPPSQTGIQMAAAVLLIEVMVSDDKIDASEQQTASAILQQQFSLSATDVDTLFAQARQENREATCLYRFTRQINDHYSAAQRFQLVVQLWRIAYADGRLDKYEEGTIRQICELIHVPHSDFIRAKQQAKS